MTLRELKDRVLLNVGEVGNEELEQAIKQEANKGLNHIAIALDLPDLRRMSTIALGNGEYGYDLSSLGRVRQVVAVLRQRSYGTQYLRYLPLQTFMELHGDPGLWPAGEPRVWTIRNVELLIFPKCSSATTLVVAWLAWPEPLVEDTDQIDDLISGTLTAYVTAMIHLSLENTEAHRYWLRQALQELEHLKADKKSPKAFHGVESPEATGTPYYLDPFCKGV